MKSNLLKYKHYLAVLLALAVANYIIDPLWNNLIELQQKIYLGEVKAVKVEGLIAAKSDIEKQHGLLSISTLKLQPYLFPASTESEFKLVAQAQVEAILENAGCNVERIGWKSRNEVKQSLVRWSLEARFRGNPKCALQVTRQLESQTPLIKIADYSYAGKEVSGNKNNYMVIALTLVMWQNSQEVAL